MDYEELYNQSFNDELEKIAADDENQKIVGGWFRPDISSIEAEIPGNIYLSDEQEADIRPFLARESQKRFMLRHPILTGIPTLGIGPTVASADVREKAMRRLSKQNPEFARRVDRAVERERQLQAVEREAEAREMAARESGQPRELRVGTID